MSDWNKNKMAGLVTPPRNNYFYGKLLDESHLRMEQSYFNQKRWMMNRLGLGSGVLCGLQAIVQGDHICFSTGVVIDGKGREIVVSEAVWVDPKKITDDMGVPTGEVIGEDGVYVCLAYRECPAEPVPVLVTDCDSTNLHAPSVIRESFRVLVKKGIPPPLPEVLDPKLCNALHGTDAEAKRREIFEVLRSRTCSANDSQACVVLAGITLKDGKITVTPGETSPLVYSNPELFEMLMCLAEGASEGTPGPKGDTGPRGDTGPQGVPGKGLDEKLTKITKINWEHDGSMTWERFLKDGLRIDFSDEVNTKPDHDEGWFLISIELSGSVRGDSSVDNPLVAMLLIILTLVWPKGSTFIYRAEIKRNEITGLRPAIGASGRYAHWLPGLDELRSIITLARLLLRIDGLRVLVRVVVKCDFLIDINGKCVDGNHLRGVAGDKSGDGVSGGEFESWFELTGLEIPSTSPDSLAMGSMTSLLAGKAKKRETDALEKIFPGIAELAKFFKKGG